MCLLAWNWNPSSEAPLLLLSNRDEFYARATQPLHWWAESTSGHQILAGKDLQAGGTWLGVSRSGRLAAVTNYRSAEGARPDTPSRGELVAGFLQCDARAADYLKCLEVHASEYNPFNLLVFDGQQLMGFESRGSKILTLPHGVGAVSNADFETPWTKLIRLKHRLQEQSGCDGVETEEFLKLLHDRTMASQSNLPKTGISQELEHALSSTFISIPGYGTRACSVILMGTNSIKFVEQRFDENGLQGTEQHSFNVLPAVRSLPQAPQGCPGVPS